MIMIYLLMIVVLSSFISGCYAQAEEENECIDYFKYNRLFELYSMYLNKSIVQEKEINELNEINKNKKDYINSLTNNYNILTESFDDCYNKLKNKKTTFEEYKELKEKYGFYEKISFDVGLTDNKEIIELSRLLKKNTVEDTVSNIEYWVDNNIEYEFFWSERNLKTVSRTHQGDCTDKANLLYELLWLNGIPARKVHGYLNSEKHDWIEILYPVDNWLYWKPSNCYDCEKIGGGFW